MATPEAIAGRYVLDRRLGAGGMSTVFLAMDSVLERGVAVKLLAEHLAEDEDFVARFRREALSAARLQHPNIVQVFDSGEDPTSHRHYIVMEFVDGPSCADLLRDSKELGVDQTVSIVRDACNGLEYAHRAGVVHRDVKPGNLLMADQVSATKLADFGIAKAAEQTRITQVGSVLGTAAYLSPEQARGEEAGPASDIYSLGVCAYQFLTGRLPHEYSSLTELALKQQQEEVEPITLHRPEVPAELDRAIRVSLERDPAERYSSTLDMARSLEAGLHGQDTEATVRLAQGTAAPSTEATRALGQVTSATQAMRTRGSAVPPGRQLRPRPAPVVERASGGQAVARAERRTPWARLGTALAALAALLAVGAVAYALLASDGRSRTVEPVDRGDVQQQIDDLRQFLNESSR